MKNAVITMLLLCGCDIPSQLAPRTELPMHSAPMDRLFMNDEGIVFDITEARLAVSDFQFTTNGEEHAMLDMFVSTAWAHPGHSGGGEVAGQLDGEFIIDMLEPSAVGTATMLATTYSGANMTFDLTTNVGEDDDLFGHTMVIEGHVEFGDGEYIPFRAIIDQDEDQQVIGVPFDGSVSEGDDGSLLFFMEMTNANGDSIFDGIDPEDLSDDNDGGLIEISAEHNREAWTRLTRSIQKHDFYSIRKE